MGKTRKSYSGNQRVDEKISQISIYIDSHIHADLEKIGVKNLEHKRAITKLASFNERLLFSLMMRKGSIKADYRLPSTVLVDNNYIPTEELEWLNFPNKYNTVEFKAMPVSKNFVDSIVIAQGKPLDINLLQIHIAIILGLFNSAVKNYQKCTITTLGLPLVHNISDYFSGLDKIFGQDYVIKAMAISLLGKFPLKTAQNYLLSERDTYMKDRRLNFLRSLHEMQSGYDFDIFMTLQKLVDYAAADNNFSQYFQLEQYLINLYYHFYGNEQERKFAKNALTLMKSPLFNAIENIIGNITDDDEQNKILVAISQMMSYSEGYTKDFLTKIFNQLDSIKSEGIKNKFYYILSDIASSMFSARYLEDEIYSFLMAAINLVNSFSQNWAVDIFLNNTFKSFILNLNSQPLSLAGKVFGAAVFLNDDNAKLNFLTNFLMKFISNASEEEIDSLLEGEKGLLKFKRVETELISSQGLIANAIAKRAVSKDNELGVGNSIKNTASSSISVGEIIPSNSYDNQGSIKVNFDISINSKLNYSKNILSWLERKKMLDKNKSLFEEEDLKAMNILVTGDDYSGDGVHAYDGSDEESYIHHYAGFWRGVYREIEVFSRGLKYTLPSEIREKMLEFIEWLNMEEKIVNADGVEGFAAKAFLKFINIHPFLAANGRTGRLLLNILLVRNGKSAIDLSLIDWHSKFFPNSENYSDIRFLTFLIKEAQAGRSTFGFRRYGGKNDESMDYGLVAEMINFPKVNVDDFFDLIYSCIITGELSQHLLSLHMSLFECIKEIYSKTEINLEQHEEFLNIINTIIERVSNPLVAKECIRVREYFNDFLKSRNALGRQFVGSKEFETISKRARPKVNELVVAGDKKIASMGLQDAVGNDLGVAQMERVENDIKKILQRELGSRGLEENAFKDSLLSLLSRYENSPPVYVIKNKIKDFFGLANYCQDKADPRNLTAIYEQFLNSPKFYLRLIPLLHEFLHFIIDDPETKIFHEDNVLILTYRDITLRVKLTREDALVIISQKAQEGSESHKHYFLRALLRQIFGDYDVAVTYEIKLAQDDLQVSENSFNQAAIDLDNDNYLIGNLAYKFLLKYNEQLAPIITRRVELAKEDQDYFKIFQLLGKLKGWVLLREWNSRDLISAQVIERLWQYRQKVIYELLELAYKNKDVPFSPDEIWNFGNPAHLSDSDNSIYNDKTEQVVREFFRLWKEKFGDVPADAFEIFVYTAPLLPSSFKMRGDKKDHKIFDIKNPRLLQGVQDDAKICAFSMFYSEIMRKIKNQKEQQEIWRIFTSVIEQAAVSAGSDKVLKAKELIKVAMQKFNNFQKEFLGRQNLIKPQIKPWQEAYCNKITLRSMYIDKLNELDEYKESIGYYKNEPLSDEEKVALIMRDRELRSLANGGHINNDAIWMALLDEQAAGGDEAHAMYIDIFAISDLFCAFVEYLSKYIVRRNGRDVANLLDASKAAGRVAMDVPYQYKLLTPRLLTLSQILKELKNLRTSPSDKVNEYFQNTVEPYLKKLYPYYKNKKQDQVEKIAYMAKFIFKEIDKSIGFAGNYRYSRFFYIAEESFKSVFDEGYKIPEVVKPLYNKRGWPRFRNHTNRISRYVDHKNERYAYHTKDNSFWFNIDKDFAEFLDVDTIKDLIDYGLDKYVIGKLNRKNKKYDYLLNLISANRTINLGGSGKSSEDTNDIRDDAIIINTLDLLRAIYQDKALIGIDKTKLQEQYQKAGFLICFLSGLGDKLKMNFISPAILNRIIKYFNVDKEILQRVFQKVSLASRWEDRVSMPINTYLTTDSKRNSREQPHEQIFPQEIRGQLLPVAEGSRDLGGDKSDNTLTNKWIKEKIKAGAVEKIRFERDRTVIYKPTYKENYDVDSDDISAITLSESMQLTPIQISRIKQYLIDNGINLAKTPITIGIIAGQALVYPQDDDSFSIVHAGIHTKTIWFGEYLLRDILTRENDPDTIDIFKHDVLHIINHKAAVAEHFLEGYIALRDRVKQRCLSFNNYPSKEKVINLAEYEIFNNLYFATQSVTYKHKYSDTLIKVFTLAGVNETHIRVFVELVGRLRAEGLSIVPMELVKLSDGRCGVRISLVRGKVLGDVIDTLNPGYFITGKAYVLQKQAIAILERIDELTEQWVGVKLADRRASLDDDRDDFSNFILTNDNQIINIDPINMRTLIKSKIASSPLRTDGQVAQVSNAVIKKLIRGKDVEPVIGAYDSSGSLMGNVSRGLRDAELSMENIQFRQTIRQACAKARAERRKARMLVIGVGVGRIIYDLQNEFPELELIYINKENIQLDKDLKVSARSLSNFISGETNGRQNIPYEEMEKFLQYFYNNVIIHDANDKLPFGEKDEVKADFDVVLVSNVTIDYIKNKLELCDEVKRVLRKDGVGFIIVDSAKGFLVQSDIETTLHFFNNLTNGEYVYAGNRDHIYCLRINNKNPEKYLKMQLKLNKRKSKKIEIIPGLFMFKNVYEIINSGELNQDNLTIPGGIDLNPQKLNIEARKINPSSSLQSGNSLYGETVPYSTINSFSSKMLRNDGDGAIEGDKVPQKPLIIPFDVFNFQGFSFKIIKFERKARQLAKQDIPA